MAEYPGNAALSPEVKQKILSTFRHTATLFQQGKKDDTIVGCDFILKLDPRFAPAQQLLSSAKGGAPIDVAALLASLESGPSPTGAPDFAGLLSRARAALEERDFSGAASLAGQVLGTRPDDPDASEIVSQAQELIEAQPFVAQFVQKARTALASGDASEASRQADKAWQIDPTNPDIKAVRAAISEALAPGTGFEFQGEETEEIGIATPPTEDALAFEAPAPEAFGFQFAPDEDVSAIPTIDLAPPPPDEAPEEAPPPFAAPAPPAAFSFDASAPPMPQAFSFDSAPAAPAAPPPPRPVAPPPPPAAPAPPAAFSFDSAAPSLGSAFGGDAGQNEKVKQYLDEGDRAYEAGDYQGAIDIWSRIFLVDITSQVATERIERAKKAKQERDRQVGAIVTEAGRLIAAGSPDEAKAKLAEALALDPANAAARGLLEQIGAGGASGAGSDRGILGPSTAKPAGGAQDVLSDDFLGDFVPPPPPEEEASESEGMYSGEQEGVFPEEAAAPVAAAPSRKKGVPLPIVAASAALLLIVAGAVWFFFLRSTGPANDGPKGPDGEKLIYNAQGYVKLDRLDDAIGELGKVKPDDPAYSRALKLIDDIKKKKASAGALPSPAQMVGGRPAAEVAAELKEKGRAALEAGKYLEAMPLLDQASRLVAGDVELQHLLEQVTEKVTQLQSVLKSFNEQNYEAAIQLLWKMKQADPTNIDVDRLLTNSYYNLGVGELQGGTAEKARANFKEVMGLHPDDVLAERNMKLAEKYSNRPKDLMYRIYTKNLQVRASNQ
jgi:tetratricopeptide (TPR) repeat protein